MQELVAELVTHDNETLEQVNRRLAQERFETPHQIRLRREHEARVVAWRESK